MEYRKLSKGGEMISARCPFRVDQQTHIHTIAEYFK